MRTCAQAVLSRSTLTSAHSRALRSRSCIRHRNNHIKADALTHLQDTHLQDTRQMAILSNDRTHSLPPILGTGTDPLPVQCSESLLVHQVGTSSGLVHQLLFRHLNHNHRALTSASPHHTMIAKDGSTDLDHLHTQSVAATRLVRLATPARLQRLHRRGHHQQAVLRLLRRDLGRDHHLHRVLTFLGGNQ